MLNSSFIFFFLVYVTGFCMKFFRLPFHTIIMAVGAIGILIIGILFLITKDKKRGLQSLTTSAWCLYLISVVKFLPQTYFLLTAIVVTMITLVYLIRNTPVVKVQSIAAGLVFLTSIVVALQAKDERYYLFNIKYNHHVDQDYWAWDKYSWFLYQGGKYEKAKMANDKASSIVGNSDDENMKDLIYSHQYSLKENKWESYK